MYHNLTPLLSDQFSFIYKYRNKHCLQRFLFISGCMALDRFLPKNGVKSIQLQLDENYEFLAIILSNKIDLNAKLSKRDRKGHYIFIEGKIHQPIIAITNMYAPTEGHSSL